LEIHDLVMASEDVFQPWLSRWRLVPEGEAISTHSSLLLPVRSDGAPAMSKIAMAEEELNGAHLMAWYAGDGAARVLAHEGRGLLLERLSGRRSLVEMERSGRGAEATRIICEVVARLHAARDRAPPETLYPMATRFRQLEPAATRSGGVLTKSATAARELLATPQRVVPLHGDIHHGNILDGDERGWLAIDPKGVLGERKYALDGTSVPSHHRRG
jgi:streptomycin 6-kinase